MVKIDQVKWTKDPTTTLKFDLRRVFCMYLVSTFLLFPTFSFTFESCNSGAEYSAAPPKKENRMESFYTIFCFIRFVSSLLSSILFNTHVYFPPDARHTFLYFVLTANCVYYFIFLYPTYTSAHFSSSSSFSSSLLSINLLRASAFSLPLFFLTSLPIFFSSYYYSLYFL